MSRLLKSFFYKVSKDITFRITLIVGVGVAVFMTLLYFVIGLFMDEQMEMTTLTGQSMLVGSFSPVQSFGFAIPINIAVFIVLEFTQGTIRNKIIAGYSKFKIYASLFISGLVLAFALLLTYVATCTLFGAIFGGFDLSVTTMAGMSGIGTGVITAEYIIKYVILALFSYCTIVAFSVFIATLCRNIGPCIPLILITIFGIYYLTMLFGVAVSTVNSIMDASQNALVELKEAVAQETDPNAIAAYEQQIAEVEKTIAGTQSTYDTVNIIASILKCVDPQYGLAYTDFIREGNKSFTVMDNLTFFGGIGGNLAFTAAFFFGGACLFKKRDIK